MTAWMYYHNGGYPTLHSDFALSTRLSGSRQHNYPVFDVVDETGSSLVPAWQDGFHPAGLCQKIVVISPDIAFAWAGGLYAAQALETELRNLAGSDALNDVSVIKSLQDRYSKAGLTAIIMTYFSRPAIQIATISSLPLNLMSLGDVILGGSGEGGFYGLGGELLANLHPDIADERVAKGTLTKAESDAIVRRRLLDSKLQIRMMTQEFNPHATGGGVDTVIADPTRGFYRMADYLYAIFFNEDENDVSCTPGVIVRRSYSDEFIGISFNDYRTDQIMNVTVPTPARINQSHEISVARHDPFNSENILGVSCIHVRPGRGYSHYMESPEIFYANVKRDSSSRKISVSQWYQDDIKRKRVETDTLTNLVA